MFYVYAIKSRTRNYVYVGITNNLNLRLSQHNKGQNKTTAPYKPFTLLYKEFCETRKLAREREKYLKSGIGKEWLKKKCN